MDSEQTQRQRILQHLNTGAELTPLQALNMFGCFRLAARVAELRNMGHKIETERRKDGGGACYAVYRVQNGTA